MNAGVQIFHKVFAGEELVAEWRTSSTTIAPKLIVFHDDSVKNLCASTV